MASVAGKTAFITGGARGVGAEVARQLHARGANVVLTDLDEQPLAALTDELGASRVSFELVDQRSERFLVQVGEHDIGAAGV